MISGLLCHRVYCSLKILIASAPIVSLLAWPLGCCSYPRQDKELLQCSHSSRSYVLTLWMLYHNCLLQACTGVKSLMRGYGVPGAKESWSLLQRRIRHGALWKSCSPSASVWVESSWFGFLVSVVMWRWACILINKEQEQACQKVFNITMVNLITKHIHNIKPEKIFATCTCTHWYP